MTHVERRTQNDVSTPEKFLEDSTKALLHYLESGPRDSERMTAMLGYARLVAEARRLLSARNKSAMGRKNIGESLSTLKDERALREPSVFKKQALKAARTLGNILDGEAIAREHASDFVSRRDDESHGVAAIIETLSRDLSRALKMSEPICFEELEALSMAPSPSAISCATDVRAVLEKLAPADPSGETKKFDPKGFLTDVAPDFFRQRDKTEGDKRDQRKRPPARKTTPTGPIMAVPSEKRKFSTGPTPGHLQMIQERAREEQLRKEAAHRAALAEELAEITQETQGWLDRKDTLSSYDEDTVTKRLDEMLADMLTHRSNDGPALSGYQQAVSYLAVRDENRMRLAQLNGRRGYLISEIETSSGKKAGPKGQTRSRVASIVEDPSTELGRVSDEITAVEKTIAECDAGIAILAVEGLFQPEAYFLVRDVLGPWSSPARAGLSEAKAKSVSPQIPESESEYRTHVVTKLREALKESHRYRAQNSELRQAYDRITAYASMIAGAREAKKTYDDAVKAVKTLRHRVNNTLGATSLQNALAARKNEKGASWDSKETIIENLQQRYEALENAEACVTEVDFEGLMTDFETALSRHMDTLRSQDTGPHSQTA